MPEFWTLAAAVGHSWSGLMPENWPWDSGTETPPSHYQLLSEIFGVDRATFPAQLSIINLAVRNITQTANYPRVARQDFFEARKGESVTYVTSEGGPAGGFTLENLDAVVGNPPYIRQEQLSHPYKDQLKALFSFRVAWPDRSNR